MRVGILTSVHPPADTRILFKEARTLVQGGHEVFLVARSSVSPIGLGVHHVALPIPRTRLARVLTCARLLRAAARLRCNVYHFHDPELLPVGVILKWVTGASLVFDVHEDVRRQIRNKYWIHPFLRGLLARAYGLAERICLLAVDRVIIAEDSYARFYERNAPFAVRNYPTLDLLESLGNWDRSKQYSSQPRLVYCGTIARIRGVMEMLQAVRLLVERYPAVHLSLIGSYFPESLAEEVRDRIHDLGLESHVTVHGRLRLDDAMAIVTQCDIGLALLHPDPNYIHSLPTKMFEYMALRLPVVVSDFELWRGIVEQSAAGCTADPLSPEKIAAAIGRIWADHSTLIRMGERGCDAVRRVYSWAPEGQRLLEMYRELGAERGLAVPSVLPEPSRGSASVMQDEPTLTGAGE